MADGATCISHIIHQYGHPVLNITYQDHGCHLICFLAFFVDQGKLNIQSICYGCYSALRKAKCNTCCTKDSTLQTAHKCRDSIWYCSDTFYQNHQWTTAAKNAVLEVKELFKWHCNLKGQQCHLRKVSRQTKLLHVLCEWGHRWINILLSRTPFHY
jgi:hypothetical protein